MPYVLHPIWKIAPKDLSEDELWEHFDKCLKAHDWTYQYSDDHGVWRAGEDEKRHLENVREILREVDEDRADTAYFTGCPWTNPDGSRSEKW